jgi:hypothetical protein
MLFDKRFVLLLELNVAGLWLKNIDRDQFLLRIDVLPNEILICVKNNQ